MVLHILHLDYFGLYGTCFFWFDLLYCNLSSEDNAIYENAIMNNSEKVLIFYPPIGFEFKECPILS